MNFQKRIAAACILTGMLTGTAWAQFDSQNVSLRAWFDLNDLAASNGNDCWGYVSSSGREYALMGVSNKLAVFEITDPANPVEIGSVSHTDSLWGDVKTYGQYAYVVNESGGGLDVVDLSDVDNGNVSLVQRVTTGGLQTSHNVAIDPDSGYLYLCGANINGGRLVAYDLSDPTNPTFAGQVNSAEGTYVHDAEIATFTSGPNAGKQIAYCANGGTGLDIYDVTDKGNMFRLSRTTYPNLSYAHQCWLSSDGNLLYLNDELDGVNETVVFDVSDVSDPSIAHTYNSSVPATDHNLYIHEGFAYEADYRAGLRIFCLEDPLNPVQVGWFDTFPANNDDGFDGAWSNYPMFPSGTIIVSDINRGFFVLDPSDALTAGALTFAYPAGRPELMDPQGDSLSVEVSGICGASPISGSGLLNYDGGDGFVAVPMDEISENVYNAVFPALDCGTQVSYYISAESSTGQVVTDPADAPNSTYSASVAEGINITIQDDFEADLGWVATNLGATSGLWERGVPVDDPDWAYDPTEDGDGSGQAYLTGNQFGNSDIDDGAVRLTSAMLDMSSGGVGIGYEYFLRLTVEDGLDQILVEISSNGDAGPWTTIAVHDTNGGLAWRHHDVTAQMLQDAGVELTSTMKVRFTANDANEQSIVEAGIDGFTVFSFECTASCPGDFDGDNAVDITDLLELLSVWGACPGCPQDINGDGQVSVEDLLTLLGSWGACP